MEGKQAIVFYFPHHRIGGVSILFLRMAEYLSSKFSVYVADYSDGYMANHLSSNVKLLRIDQGDHFPEGSIYIFQSFLPWRFPFLAKVDPHSKVFFWNLHPNNFDPSIFNEKINFYPFKIIAKLINFLAWKRKNKVKKVINYLVRNQGLEFMDVENVRSTEDFIGERLDIKKFLPIATPKLNERNQYTSHSEVKLGWIGRLADFKYRILEHLMHRLSQLNIENKTITLTIVGDGDYRDYLKREATLLGSSSFRIIFIGELSPHDLHKYMRENIDIVFSMGSSALEAASMGLPVFLTDYSYEKIKYNYNFSMLYEKKGYCLGEKINNQSFEEGCSLRKSIVDVINNYDFYSQLCHQYWKNNFSLDSVANSLDVRMNLSTATFADMKKKGFFTPDKFGLLMRTVGWRLRLRNLKEVVGFRHDC